MPKSKTTKPKTFETDINKGHYELTPVKISQAVNNAKNKGTNPELLKILASHPLERVRIALAANPAVSDSVKLMLSRDFSWRVRLELTKNPSLSKYFMTQMLHEERINLIANSLLNRLSAL